ncbi:hypothetical protein [Vibrio nigripulchritudo]|uniref:hypothetical protein n=1 Tax=Vibrio nigripulchritudo TaxID=28173 RepID=UPI0003B1F29B|nr:hypothetical protein [Vibrio nigripulchritudo]CCN68577.1 membrane hypothetical protein [Vibrio nigripulchritudo SFn118]
MTPNTSAINTLINELNAMVQHATGLGEPLPTGVLHHLDHVLFKQNQTQGEKYPSPYSADDLQQLTDYHQMMAELIEPAQPRSVLLIKQQEQQRGVLGFLGPVTLVRQLTGLAIFCVVMTIALALSPEINRETINQDLFENSGISLLLNLLFLLCCAGLGATFSNLNKLFYYIDSMTYDPRFNSTYWIRIIMGFMSGLMIAELLPLGQMQAAAGGESTVVDLDKPLAAILGGFSSDVLYRFLSRLLELVEQLFKSQPSGSHGKRQSYHASPPPAKHVVYESKVAANANNMPPSLQPVTEIRANITGSEQGNSETPIDALDRIAKDTPNMNKEPETHFNQPQHDQDTLTILQLGKLTYDAEGTEGGRYHSRKLHVPSESSGLTIGRGYDCKEKSTSQIINQLCEAGLPLAKAQKLAGASGLSGQQASDFIADNQLEDYEITVEQQEKLFAISYQSLIADVKRICSKSDCVAAYGDVNWDTLNNKIKAVLVDLRYRGDYTPNSRKLIQSYVANNNVAGFSSVLCNRQLWRQVPEDRFNRRVEFLNE